MVFTVFALVLRELKFQVLHCAPNPFQYLKRNSEFTVAQSADRDSRRGSKPLQHSEVAFRHGIALHKTVHPISALPSITQNKPSSAFSVTFLHPSPR